MMKDMKENTWKVLVDIYKNPDPIFSKFTSI